MWPWNLVIVVAVSLTLNGHISAQGSSQGTGSLGPWSSWSSCTKSRSCQVELSSRSRTCYSPGSTIPYNQCLGDTQEYKTCDTTNCIQLKNEAQTECDRQNRVAFRGRMYTWQAYFNRHSPCEVTCQADYFGFITGFGRFLKNGVSCGRTTSGEARVCLKGKCQIVGCDGVVGSGVRKDHCGECGGNNESCRIIAGIYTHRHLKHRYNKVTHIPKGACHINITELARSRNYLVVSYTNGSGIINSDRKTMTRPGNYFAAGTLFKYDKMSGPGCPGECIVAEGPITDDIDIQLLNYRINVGIKYMFTIPNHLIDTVLGSYDGSQTRRHGHHRSGRRKTDSETTQENPRINYNQRPEYVSPDDTSNAAFDRYQALEAGRKGQRTQDAINLHRQAYASNDRSNIINKNSVHNNNVRSNNIPQAVRQGATRVQAPGNQVGYQPTNSDSNIFSGSQLYNRDYGVAAASRGTQRNIINNRKPKLIVPNTIDEVNFHWTISGFTECSRTCGGGTQDTKVVCMKRKTNVIVTDDNCDPAKKNVQTVVCNKSPCPPDWNADAWSVCSTTCGLGRQTRRVECQQRYSENVSYPVSARLCNFQERPLSSQSCETRPCAEWSTSNWTKCSVDCGVGQITRTVECVNTEAQAVDNSQCRGLKPEDSKSCDMGTCAKGWFQTAWSTECSTECGSGYHTRTVYCSAEDGSPLPEFKCGEKPRTRKPCRKSRPCGGIWFEGPWAKCTATCGEALQSRDVVCMKKLANELFAIVGEENCKEKVKPETERPCPSLPECPPEWFLTKWSECSKTCGTGVKTRDLKCLDANFDPNSQCHPEDKPSTRRTCNTQDCDLPQLDEDSGCKDKWGQCQLVVQARLCAYKFYKNQCCHSCTLHHLKHKKRVEASRQGL